MTRQWSQRWIDYGLSEAKTVARQSKDPSTQAGAAILRPDKTVASKGYNGFPRFMEDLPELYFDREEKLRRIVHAEMNALLLAREPLVGYFLFTWPFLTCDRCAPHVIQAGITTVVAPDADEELRSRWGAAFENSMTFYKECGVKVILTDPIPVDERRSRSILLETTHAS